MTADLLELSIALSDNENTRPILDGSVRAQGVRLLSTAVHPSEMFWRQLKFADFDVSEMSLSSLLIATSKAPTPWVAIPVFTSRRFFHTGIWVRADRGIEQPSDLRGKKVAVPEYQQTAVIWTRGVLQHEFGVAANEMEWFMERNPDKSHGGSTGFRAPDGVRLTYIPPSTNIGEMLAGGEIDAALHYIAHGNLVDRSRLDLARIPEVRPLFADPAAEKRRYFRQTGVFPINHTLVIRRTLLERHPWLALNLFSAFEAAKAQLRETGRQSLAPLREAGLIDSETAGLLDTDLMGYGVKSCRPVLETIARYVHEQGLASRLVGIDEIFAPSTMDL